MTDVKKLMLYSSRKNHLTVCKKRAQGPLEMFSTKCDYKSYIFNIYV